MKELQEWYELERKQEIKLKNLWKKNLKGLVNVSGLFKYLDEDNYWQPIGIVEVYETDEKTGGYSSYQHVRVKDDENDKLLYLKQPEFDLRGVDHICVWQTCGMMGDDYSGYLLFPLKNGKYFKVSYSC